MRKNIGLIVVFAFAVAMFIASSLFAASSPAFADGTALMNKVLTLLDHQPAQGITIAIVDPEKLHFPDAETRRKYTGHIGGFVVPGRPVAYISTRGDHFKAAMEGDEFELYILASETAHELIHAEKQVGECAAYTGQQELWKSYVTRGLVEFAKSTNYAAFLEKMRRESCR